MIIVSIADIKAHLSDYINKAEAGEVIIVTRHNKPVVELRSIEQPESAPRPIGLCRGEFVVPEDFDAPLPEDVLRDFEAL